MKKITQNVEEKTSPKSSTILLIFLIIMVASEIFLLNQNYSLKKKVSAYSHLEKLLEQAKNHLSTINLERSFEGKNLPFFTKQHLKIRSKNKLQLNRSKFITIFAFTLKDCSVCLENEIMTMNDIHNLYNRKISQVLGITDTTYSASLENFIHSNNVRFPVHTDVTLKKQLSEMGVAITPAIFFVNTDNMKVIYTHFVTSTNLLNREFAAKIKRILDSYEN